MVQWRGKEVIVKSVKEDEKPMDGVPTPIGLLL